jgi:hypothetical protein
MAYLTRFGKSETWCEMSLTPGIFAQSDHLTYDCYWVVNDRPRC